MARWLLPLTCVFGCPLLMGAVMWSLGKDRQMAKLEREIMRINRRAGVAQNNTTARRFNVATVRKAWCSACLNWRVLAAVGAGAVLVGLVSPRLLATAGPGLLVVICPLSMGLAMLAMGRRGSKRTAAREPIRVATRPTAAVARTEVTEIAEQVEEVAGVTAQTLSRHQRAERGTPALLPVTSVP